MRKYAVFLLLLTTAMSQAVLNADCSVQADKYGFVELKAFAGYYIDSSFYCYNANVTANVSGTTYTMDQLYTCDYTKMLQLAAGSYDITYTANYPGFESKQVQCQLNVSEQSTMSLIVYGLKAGDVFSPNSNAHIETVAVLDDYNVEANIMASLVQGSGVLKEISLTSDVLGAKVGNILLNVTEGNYTIRVRATYLNFSAQRDFNIIVTSQAQNMSISGLNLVILEPENIVYPNNSVLSLQVELQDQNKQVVSGAAVKADIYRGGEKIDTVQLAATSWYYQGSYLFDKAGEYRIVYTATKGSSTTSAVSFFVGSESEISRTANFSVRIISPSSSVYIRDSVINARVKVTKEGEPVSNASVVLLFQDQQITMDYDRFGEYTARIGPLSEGVYELKVVATEGTLVSQGKVTFMISKSVLVIDSVSPYYNQELELNKGDALKIKAIVLDEDRDIVSGALVIAKITAPDGKVLQMQLFQDSITGDYSSNLYLNDVTGSYKVGIDGSKSGYVPDHQDSQFYIEFKKEQVQVFSYYLTVENLLTLVLVIAILILLVALLRAIF